MSRVVGLLLCLFPVVATSAPIPHSADYYFMHPGQRVALEMHCYPGSGHSDTAAECRDAWQAGMKIIHSLIKAQVPSPSPDGVTWGAINQMTAPSRPMYPDAPEEQENNPAYWRLQGLSKIKDYVFSCPAHPTEANPKCKAARTAEAAPWQAADGGRK